MLKLIRVQLLNLNVNAVARWPGFVELVGVTSVIVQQSVRY
jgi:hypothetical protein